MLKPPLRRFFYASILRKSQFNTCVIRNLILLSTP
uniref:Uncharacterized protein n=1 Tax=Myoviridae sp. ctzA421 TaxID=2826719 RepID=A0A8S5LU08_9CAUD|nr:MAG TPA: hypothetical protein [Myoviridae sp. ctzA421]